MAGSILKSLLSGQVSSITGRTNTEMDNVLFHHPDQ